MGHGLYPGSPELEIISHQPFPETAHAMMLEPHWRAVADRVLEWLDRQGL